MQADRQTILSLTQTRNNLTNLAPTDKDTIIQAGAVLESIYDAIPAEREDAKAALILCLQALQAIYQEETNDFERTVKALLGTLISVEQLLGAPPNPISETMLKQALTGLELELGAANRTTAESVKEESPAIETIETSLAPATLDEVAAQLIQLDLTDKPGLESVCEALKTISANESDKNKRKLIVKAARELARIAAGKTPDAEAVFNVVSELIDHANNRQTETSPDLESEKKSEKIMPVDDKTESAQNEGLQPEANPAPPVEAKESFEFFESDTLPVDSDASLVSEFVVESYELLEAGEIALLALETEPENIENVNTVFRAFHTVKGSAAYLGLKRLTELAHHAESLLSRIRDREIQCAGGYANLALRSLDTLKEMLTAVEKSSVGKPMNLPATFAELITVLKNPEAHGVNGEAEFETATINAEAVAVASKDESISLEKIIEEALPQVLDGVSVFNPLNTDVEENAARKNHAADSSVRVRTDRLDSLIDMVGELVIAQSMLAQDSTVVSCGAHHELARKISHAGKIVRELQDLSMGMRMIPLKNTFQKMARLVRDVAKKCGKKVEFVTEGEETEIDRNMVDLIADPLIHMVRNAVDHGIEKPDAREANGKTASGKVKLAAYHAGGDVVVELTDDGAGLDREKILAKAISKNLIESEKGMTENEIFRLIFAPGFSTADSITDVSGRGVGMDVVRRNIESMRGRIEISSEKEKGSVFTVRLPLTLAITDGMLVRVGSERFIVPTVNIQLSFQPNQKMLSTVTGRGELVSLRGELMPVFRLHQLFDVRNAIENPTEALLMIVADGRRRCALLVDELLGQQQVVTKTLGQGIGKIPGVSGGAILGNGCVGLILDTAEIVALARQTSSRHDRHDELFIDQAA